jgi:acetolactate synthase small subunit
MTKHAVVAYVQDRPGVLNRVVSLFRRRAINIERLTVNRTDYPGISEMIWVVDAADISTVVAQLAKLVEVLEVREEPALASGGDGANHGLTRATRRPFTFSGLSQADGIA